MIFHLFRQLFCSIFRWRNEQHQGRTSFWLWRCSRTSLSSHTSNWWKFENDAANEKKAFVQGEVILFLIIQFENETVEGERERKLLFNLSLSHFRELRCQYWWAVNVLSDVLVVDVLDVLPEVQPPELCNVIEVHEECRRSLVVPWKQKREALDDSNACFPTDLD